MDALGAGGAAGPGIMVTDVSSHVTVINSWIAFGVGGLVTHLLGLVFLIVLAPARFHMHTHPLDAFYKAEMCWQHSVAWLLGCLLFAITGPLLVDDILNESYQNSTALYVALFFLVYIASLVWWLISMHFMIWRARTTRVFLVLAAVSAILLIVWCMVIINDTHPAHTVLAWLMLLPVLLGWYATDHCYSFRDRVCAPPPPPVAHKECAPADVWDREREAADSEPESEPEESMRALRKTRVVEVRRQMGPQMLGVSGTWVDDSWLDDLSEK